MGGKLTKQTWGENTIEFFYDHQDRPYGFIYNGVPYYYILNLQGDVMMIVDDTGYMVGRYQYDAWGNQLEVFSRRQNIADVNPLRYRGYVWDEETGLYYLNSRYYDPGVRRFISSDDASVLAIEQGSLIQANLFAYCLNNPTSSADSNGNLATELLTGAVVGGAVGAIWGGISAAMTGGDIGNGIITGALSGAVSGALSTLPVVTKIVKMIGEATAGAISSLISYYGSHGDQQTFSGAVTAAITGAIMAYLPSFDDGVVPDFVSQYVSAGVTTILTEVSHYASSSFSNKSTSKISTWASTSLRRRDTNLGYDPFAWRYYRLA